jgi:hypothetical protein
MQAIEKAIEQLTPLVSRYQSLKVLFNQFQKCIEEANKQTFPVKEISVNTLSAIKSEVNFLDRLYVISFSIVKSQGLIAVARVSDSQTNAEITQIDSVSFNGQGVVATQQPQNEDQINIKEESCCLNLLLNWLLKDAQT